MDENIFAPGEPVTNRREFSLHRKVLLCGIAWVAAIVGMAMVIPPHMYGAAAVYSPMLSPVGFVLLMGLGWAGFEGGAFILSLVGGWVYYIVLTVWCVRAKRRKVFFWLYLVLCVSLLANIGGCASMKDFHMGC